ncbi:MAG: MATE family efflux transporter [Erysipelotrichaceae bacterium]|nr:MATE family efflux transporter [Erysipelotrichaceae bacterium]
MKKDKKQQINNVIKLSIPAILTQLATIAMQYIDSAMVGRLGENASAAIGLVSTTTWLFSGILSALAVGFSVQIAHHFGAKEFKEGRIVLRHGLVFSFIISFILLVIGCSIAYPLPILLRADPSIWNDATLYFVVFTLSLPFMMLNNICASSLQCSGNMVVPSILNAVMCLLDVIFNIIFIPLYGVLGASIGTALSVIVTSLIMFIICCFIDKKLRITVSDNTKYNKIIIHKAIKICIPIALEQVARSGAMIVSTGIIAPLGNTAIAANSFAVTVESICYMPGFGVQSAATTLVGQEMGAGNYKKAKQYGNISIWLGSLIMTVMAIMIFVLCPYIFKLLTPVEEVQALAVTVLRIGCFAEPLYGVSIVSSGALRGAEDTLVPSILNLLSIWVVRITLAIILVVPLGLVGVWLANTIELCVRGILLLIRQVTSKYYFRKEVKIID